jgi:hypothetical protein
MSAFSAVHPHVEAHPVQAVGGCATLPPLRLRRAICRRYARRYAAVMARAQTLVQLTHDLVALLDEEAAERGLSRSALIREVPTEHLDERRQVSVSEAIVDGYRRVPPATPDAWGDAEQLTDQATADLLQRLDAEEDRDGHGPR